MSVFKRKRAGAESATYYIKFRFNGDQHLLNSGCATKEAAEAIERNTLATLRANRIPNLLEQLKTRHDSATGDLIAAYLAAGCPDGKMRPRTGDSLAAEKRQLETLSKFWSQKTPAQITAADCDDYWSWRKGNVTRGTGDRTTELEIGVLSNVFTWAVRSRLLDRNPIEKRVTYRDPKSIRHCREVMPTSGDELHTIAGALMAEPRSEITAWAVLLEALTGLRSEEVRLLRADAQRIGAVHQPGYMDERYLYVQRCKRGVNPQIRLDDPTRPHLRPMLTALLSWKAARFPDNPWFLPGRAGAQLGEGAVTHALSDVCKRLNLPHRTSHGLRAYYVTTRRAQGIDDNQIAFELGQGSGPDLIRQVYGEPPAHWQGLANSYTWIPASAAEPIAWEKWSNVVLLPAQGVA